MGNDNGRQGTYRIWVKQRMQFALIVKAFYSNVTLVNWFKFQHFTFEESKSCSYCISYDSLSKNDLKDYPSKLLLLEKKECL